jgi:hypothetical protein
MVIEAAFEVEGFGVIGVELVKWVELEEPSPWGAASFDSNWGLGKLC